MHSMNSTSWMGRTMSPSCSLLDEDDAGIMSEAETSSTGFRRGVKLRSSLPVVRTASRTLERPLGEFFFFFLLCSIFLSIQFPTHRGISRSVYNFSIDTGCWSSRLLRECGIDGICAAWLAPLGRVVAQQISHIFQMLHLIGVLSIRSREFVQGVRRIPRHVCLDDAESGQRR